MKTKKEKTRFMKVLVIGKHGYVSTTFQNYMKHYPEYKVTAITARDNAWMEKDFSDYDAVFNTAGLAHNDARKGTDEQFMALNAILPLDLAKKAKAEGVSVFINMSSMIVYGQMRPIGLMEKITANTIPVPDNIYGKSKLVGEKGILELNDGTFHVAVIRSPLVYSPEAIDNFLKLSNCAIKLPIFPYIKNERSMIYADNLCELVHLIIENKSSGIFFPQQEVFICTSQIMKDIADEVSHKIWMPKFFNPILGLLSRRIVFVRRVFGNLAYDMETSNHFDGAYRIVDYPESIKRIAATKKGKN